MLFASEYYRWHGHKTCTHGKTFTADLQHCCLSCRVDFKTQNNENVDIELVQAAKEFFDNGAPSFWDLTALLLPTPFLPLLRFLAKKFPSKASLKTKAALETLYDASDNLIEVIQENTKYLLAALFG